MGHHEIRKLTVSVCILLTHSSEENPTGIDTICKVNLNLMKHAETYIQTHTHTKIQNPQLVKKLKFENKKLHTEIYKHEYVFKILLIKSM